MDLLPNQSMPNSPSIRRYIYKADAPPYDPLGGEAAGETTRLCVLLVLLLLLLGLLFLAAPLPLPLLGLALGARRLSSLLILDTAIRIG